MNLPIGLDGPRLEPASGGPARQLVVLLHGLGADGEDLIGLAPYLAQALPEAAFAAPDAPFPCDMGPMGYQWFSLQIRDPEQLYWGAEGARGPIDRFLDAELDRLGLTAAELALVGFSQGTMMALHTALRRPEPVAGIVGFSGALVEPLRLTKEIASRPPVLLVHGEADPVVPFQALAAAEQGLTALDVPVETLSRPGLAHSIDEAGLRAAIGFLTERFAEG
ncbi:phospholipase/carboxylesterase [Tistlia consotensis]|uniref:Phospholipase/carboxylesterase n=1 Tax=Tistlia consotensis USBA 355 TaxID=560819 RepID=A0A1Y6BCP0_9PROT|nr:alpha/beta fold hydrolase [Tistlia consotensis]SME97867.1 phospholipase/carboxylesterase [Tistlia consotensis USBA 355]SNR57238.1 phospholipase/carboxylesterase [Tistlia consotensis]